MKLHAKIGRRPVSSEYPEYDCDVVCGGYFNLFIARSNMQVQDFLGIKRLLHNTSKRKCILANKRKLLHWYQITFKGIIHPEEV